MRSALIAVLAFAAGILLMQLVAHAPSSVHSSGLASPSTAEQHNHHDGDDDEDIAAPTDDWPTNAPSPEQVFYDQPRLMQAAIHQLQPRIAGRPNLYAISFAGDGEENVFRNEAEYAGALVDQRLTGGPGHSLVLENNPSTLQSKPLATWSNLEAGLNALSKIMNPQQDILLLYLSSHGSEDHSLLLDMDPLPLDQLGAADLARILQKYPFKWKVVVVNACYAGGFIPPLRSPGTLILTAAAADRSSFGCGNDAAATYFGRAWLVDGLNHNADFIQAFQLASGEIASWEQKDHIPASHPQIDIGAGIAVQLEQWRRHLPAHTPQLSYPLAASLENPAEDAD